MKSSGKAFPIAIPYFAVVNSVQQACMVGVQLYECHLICYLNIHMFNCSLTSWQISQSGYARAFQATICMIIPACEQIFYKGHGPEP